MLLLNLLLALAWMVLTGDTGAGNFLLGAGLGFVLLWLAERPVAKSPYFGKVAKTIAFAGFFIWELVRGSARVGLDILTPSHRVHPAVIILPLEARTDGEITLLACLITLTPGVLTIGISPDRSVMYVHTMYAAEEEEERRQIKDGFERRLLEILR